MRMNIRTIAVQFKDVIKDAIECFCPVTILDFAEWYRPDLLIYWFKKCKNVAFRVMAEVYRSVFEWVESAESQWKSFADAISNE